MDPYGDGGRDERVVVLYRRHRDELIRLALGMTGDAGRAERIVQDAFARVHGRGRVLRDQRAALGYLRRAVVSQAGAGWLSRRRVPPPAPGAGDPVDGEAGPGGRTAVLAAVSRLPARQRACLLLRCSAGLSESETGEALTMPARAVRNQTEQGARSVAAAVLAEPGLAEPGLAAWAMDGTPADVARELGSLLRAALDQAAPTGLDWVTGLADIAGQARRHRLRRQLSSAGSVAVAVAAVAAFVLIPGGRIHRPAPPVRLTFRQTASVWFSSPSAQLAYGGGWLFAVLADPARLVRLDPATLAVTGELALGGPGVNLDPVAYGDGAVWVADSAGRRLWRVDPASMRVTLRQRTGGDVSALAYGDGALWLAAGNLGGQGGRWTGLERIDPGTGRLTGAVRLPARTRCAPPGLGLTSPAAALAVGRVILVADPQSPVYAVDPQRLSVLRTFHIRSGCGTRVELAAGPQGLYAAAGRAVVRLDLATGRVAARGPDTGLNLPELEPLTPALGGLWYTPAAVYRVGAAVRLDPVTLTVTARTKIYASVLLVVGHTLYASEYGGITRIEVTSHVARQSPG